MRDVAQLFVRSIRMSLVCCFAASSLLAQEDNTQPLRSICTVLGRYTWATERDGTITLTTKRSITVITDSGSPTLAAKNNNKDQPREGEWLVCLVGCRYLDLTAPTDGARIFPAQVAKSDGLRVTIQVAGNVAADRSDGEPVWLLRLHSLRRAQVQAIPPLTSLKNDLAALPGLTKNQTLAFARTRGQMRQIGLALANFDDTFNTLPPAIIYGPDGTPWHSWRVLLLPWLE